jgi:hypothetical protein
MRFRARLVLGLYGVALAVPAVVMAGPVGDDEPMPGMMEAQAPQQMPAEPHHHKGLFGRRHCVECQRAYAKSHDGVDVPAPPPIEAAGMQGQVMNKGAYCPTCQGNLVVSGPVTSHDPHAPGYAVVGGPVGPGGPDAPGYAVIGEAIGGAEPAPVGLAKARTNGPTGPRTAAMQGRPGGGPVDPSVVPTNIPPAPDPMAGPGHNRPRIISHLFGLPNWGQTWRDREERERQKHASISFGQNDHPAMDVPASVVYKQ